MANIIPDNYTIDFSFDKESSTYLGIAIGAAIIIGIVIGGIIYKVTG